MPRFIGYYVGISFQAELLAMTLLGLLNSTLEWYPFDWTHQVEKIWELSLSQHYFIFYTDFEYWIKTILTWIVITRKIVAYIYTFSYMVNFYPILTWSHPNLLLPWLILSFFQNFILKSIVIMIFLWLWCGEKFSLIRMIEFILVEFLSLITSAYIWYAKACSYIQLKRIKKIRHIRKALLEKYSINYDLFSSDSSNMEISKESSYGSSLGEHRHMSLPNLNEAFYRSIFSDNYNDNKLSRSLTTLSTINSFSDSEGFISQIVHNTDLMPAEKCMKLLGITDVDVINARARVRKRMLATCPRTEKKERDYVRTFASKKVRRPRKDDTVKMHDIERHATRGPSIVDYLMTTTVIPGPVFQTNDTRTKLTSKEMDRKENYVIRKQEREMEYFTPDTEADDKKNEESFIQTKNKQIVESEMEKEFEQPQKSAVDFVIDRTDEKEETKLQFVKKKKKKKVCPLMTELIESRPCYSLVGRRKFKGCLFMKDTVPSCPPFPCFSARKNKHLNNTNFTKTDAKASQAESNENISSKDVFKDNSTVAVLDVNYKTSFINNCLQSESSTDEATMREPTNKRSENCLTLKESSNMETLNLPKSKELRLEPRRNFNHIFNNRLNVLPVSNVWSTIGCLPFRQKFNFTSLYGRELQFDKSLFKPSSSQELFDRGRLIAWNPSSTELLLKVPEQVVCYTGLEYKPVSIPGTSNGTQFAKDKLQRLDSIDQESIEIPRYTSIEYSETKRKLKDDHPFYVSQGVVTETRNLAKDFDSRNNRKMISTQTTESIENYNYEIVHVAGNKNNYNIYSTDNIFPKFVSKMCATSSLDHISNITDDFKNNSHSNISREGSIENESCCCKDSYNQFISERSNTSSLTQVVHKPEYEKLSYSNKPPVYPKKSKKKSLHRLTGVKNKIVKVSFESNKYLEHYNRLRGKRVTSSIEREQLEMKALRAYNKITLFEDKREMIEKTRRMTEEIYSFVNDTKDFKMQKVQNKRQVEEKNDYEDSSNEIEIANTADSSFECISSFNYEKSLKDKDNIDSSIHEPSCSRLPDIQNKDAAIMLNLLNHHGSQWFKQELRRILAMKNSQVNVKRNEPRHYALKLDKFLTNCQKNDYIRDGHELEKSCGKENISIPFQVPLSYNYLQTRSNLDENRNVTKEKQDTMVLNLMESILSEVFINSVDFTDFAERTENNEVKEERETLTTNLPKEDESKDTEISKNDLTNIEINNLPRPSTNSVPPSPCTRMHVNAMESTDVSNHHEEVRRRNMSIHMVNIARNIGWSLRPNGIVLTNKNLQSQSFESTNSHDGQQRDIIDYATASLVHAATSHKPEIIIRTFPHDSRSMTDQSNAEEYTASFFDDIYNTYRLMSTIDELILHANNEMSFSMGDTLMLPEIQEEEDETNNLDDSIPSSYHSMETERNFDLCIVVMENDDLSLESISTSMESVPGDEVIEHDSVDIITRSDETRKMNVTDPRIDSSEEEAMKDLQQPSLEMIIAFFCFLLTCYVHYLRSYLFSISDSSSSFYSHRPCEVHSNKKSFPEKSLNEQCDVLALSNSTNNANELVVESGNEQGIGVIEFTDEVDNDDEVSIESTNQQVSSLRDSFDTVYSQSTAESENAISIGEGSSMEEFS